MTVVANSPIFLAEREVPRIKGPGTRVVMVVMDTLNGMTPEQIHAAPAYCCDHQDELDREIARESKDIAARRPLGRAEDDPVTRDVHLQFRA